MDLLAVGHCARDEFPGEPWRLGGSALYAAATAARLGAAVALVTPVGPNERPALEQRCAALGIALRPLRSSVTTTFAFRYEAGRRSLKLRARARRIAAGDVPAELRAASAVVLGTVARELDDGLFDAFPGATVVLAAQGYLRSWDADGTVRPRRWDGAEETVGRAAATVVSEEDLAGEEDVAARWSRRAPVIVTLAERGARVYRDGGAAEVSAFGPARVVDPTGAGDAFAAGLALALREGRSLLEAARFANAVASFSVEAVGTAGLAERRAVEARLAGGAATRPGPGAGCR